MKQDLEQKEEGVMGLGSWCQDFPLNCQNGASLFGLLGQVFLLQPETQLCPDLGHRCPDCSFLAIVFHQTCLSCRCGYLSP